MNVTVLNVCVFWSDVALTANITDPSQNRCKAHCKGLLLINHGTTIFYESLCCEQDHTHVILPVLHAEQHVMLALSILVYTYVVQVLWDPVSKGENESML